MSVDAARDAARAVAASVRAALPSLSPATVSDITLIAAGILLAESTFPDLPAEKAFTHQGKLFAAGVKLGRDDRAARERDACVGRA